jgi:hypothetical protein
MAAGCLTIGAGQSASGLLSGTFLLAIGAALVTPAVLAAVFSMASSGSLLASSSPKKYDGT